MTLSNRGLITIAAAALVATLSIPSTASAAEEMSKDAMHKGSMMKKDKMHKTMMHKDAMSK